MPDTLQFRGAASTSISSTTVADREIIFDTTSNRLVLGSAKDYVHTEDSAYSKTEVDNLIANNPGPQGPEGPAGPQGLTGAPGATGSQGPAGATGPQGPAGPTGAAGPQGPAGADGQDGTGISLQGTIGTVGPPSFNGTSNGDVYIDTNGDGWAWDGSSWTNVGAIQGPQGPAGPAGAAGAAGADGADGAQGPQGPEGPQGPAGPAGAQGLQGPAGQGVPTGGSSDQVLSKIDGTDYNTQWTTPVKLDAAQSFTAAQRGSVDTLNDGSTITPDFAVANNFVVVLGGTGRTLANPSNLTPGQSGVIVIKQDGTGSRTITTYGSNFKFAGGTAPTLTSDANAIDVLSYFVISATEIVATLGADFS